MLHESAGCRGGSPPRHRSRAGDGDVKGFSLLEAIVATVITVIAALGLAYTFGIGRSNINRFEVARIADAMAQSRIEFLGALALASPTSDSLELGLHPATPSPFLYHGNTVGIEYWRVDAAPTTLPLNIGGSLSRVTAIVSWTMGGLADSVTYTRLVPKP